MPSFHGRLPFFTRSAAMVGQDGILRAVGKRRAAAGRAARAARSCPTDCFRVLFRHLIKVSPRSGERRNCGGAHFFTRSAAMVGQDGILRAGW